MMTLPRVFLIGAMVLVPLVATAETNEEQVLANLEANFMTTTLIPEAIYFHGLDDTDVLVEPGLYQVSRKEENLQLTKVGAEGTYTLKAEIKPLEESVQEPVAMNVYGDVVDEPDISVLMLQLPDGTQLVAEGSYSGIRPRGMRDRLRAARAALQQHAKERRARKADRQKKRADRQTLRQQVRAMPKLSQTQTNQLKQRAKEIRQQNKGMLGELVRRVKNNRPLLTIIKRKGIRNLSQTDIQNFLQTILGTGDRALRLSTWPKGDLAAAARQPVSRGIGDNGFSWSLGASWDASAIVGVGAGAFQGLLPLPPPFLLLGRTHYISASTSAGVQAGVSGNVDIGFWNSQPGDLGGCDYAVQGAGAVLGGIGVSVVFQGKPGTDFRFSGIQIDPGAGAEFSAAVVAGCATATH